MNFIAFAFAIFAACMALNSLSMILRVAVGKVRWNSDLAPVAQAFYVAMFGTGAVALFVAAFK